MVIFLYLPFVLISKIMRFGVMCRWWIVWARLFGTGHLIFVFG